MEATTVTLTRGVEAMLEVFLRAEKREGQRDTIIDEAVREYLSKRGYVPPRGPLRITPAPHGSGDPLTSIEHDRVLAERDPH